MEIEVSEDGFIAAVRTMEGGALPDELDRALIKCVQAIQERGGKAELTLKVKIERMANMDTAVVLSSEVATKVPKEERQKKVLFVTNGSGLSDQQQDQQAFDLGAPVKQQKSPLQPVTRIGANNNDK